MLRAGFISEAIALCHFSGKKFSKHYFLYCKHSHVMMKIIFVSCLTSHRTVTSECWFHRVMPAISLASLVLRSRNCAWYYWHVRSPLFSDVQ